MPSISFSPTVMLRDSTALMYRDGWRRIARSTSPGRISKCRVSCFSSRSAMWLSPRQGVAVCPPPGDGNNGLHDPGRWSPAMDSPYRNDRYETDIAVQTGNSRWDPPTWAAIPGWRSAPYRGTEWTERILQAQGIGMVRFLEQVYGACLFHELTTIHDRNAITHLGDNRDIVGNQDDGAGNLAADFPHPPQNPFPVPGRQAQWWARP